MFLFVHGIKQININEYCLLEGYAMVKKIRFRLNKKNQQD